MPLFNTTAKEVTAKIVYYGPGLCGKTTNLEQIHDRVAPNDHGRLISIATSQERTLFFDMLPIGNVSDVHGFKLRFQLYTVPGQVYYNASRRLVLKEVDGIVFVADSQPTRYEANIESMQNMYDNLASLGLNPDDIPLVLQYNKRDVPGCLPIDVLQQSLNYDDVPAFQAVACRGIGVFETLGEIMQQVERRLRAR